MVVEIGTRRRLSQPTATTPAMHVRSQDHADPHSDHAEAGCAASLSKITSGASDISYGSRNRPNASVKGERWASNGEQGAPDGTRISPSHAHRCRLPLDSRLAQGRSHRSRTEGA